MYEDRTQNNNPEIHDLHDTPTFQIQFVHTIPHIGSLSTAFQIQTSFPLSHHSHVQTITQLIRLKGNHFLL